MKNPYALTLSLALPEAGDFFSKVRMSPIE
jgi:hypothetical protein